MRDPAYARRHKRIDKRRRCRKELVRHNDAVTCRQHHHIGSSPLLRVSSRRQIIVTDNADLDLPRRMRWRQQAMPRAPVFPIRFPTSAFAKAGNN